MTTNTVEKKEIVGKAVIIDLVAEKTGLMKTQLTKAYDAILEVLEESLVGGKVVCFNNVLSLSVVAREARNGRNIKTGEKIVIPAKNAVRARVGKRLKTVVAGTTLKK